MVWMFVSPLNSYVEILTPKEMVLGGGAFGRWLGHEGRELACPFHNEVKLWVCTPEEGLHQNPTMLAPWS